MKRTLKQGVLITIEGIDGSGKSTLARALVEQFSHDIACLLTKEPGGSPLGKHLRPLVQHEALSAQAEFLLFAADRAEHIHAIIKPALAQGMLVISDRMADSSLAYQGYGKGLSLSIMQTINTWVMDGIEPDLTIYVKITPEEAQKRLHQRNEVPTKFETEKNNFMERVAHGYDELFASRTNVITVDAHQSIQTLIEHTYESVSLWLKTNNYL